MLGERLTNLLSLFSEDKFQTAESFAAELNTSTKTVRNLIKQLEEALRNNGAHIIAKHGYGYQIKVYDKEKLNKFLNPGKSSYLPDTSMERVQYLLEYLLNSKDYVKTENLSDMLYVSKKTLASDLKEVEQLLKRYDISLVRKPYYGIKAVGEEFHLRLCIAEYIEMKIMRNLFRGGSEMQTELNDISYCIMECLEYETYKISDVALQNLIIHIHIAIKRIQEAHYIPMGEEQFLEWVSEEELRLAKKCTDKIGKKFHIEFPEQEIGYVAIHLAGKKMQGEDGVDNKNLVISNEVNETVVDMLEEIYAVFRIDLRSDLELIMSLGQHLVPLTIRMRFGMKMKNPLLKDIKERFSLAYTMASQASVVIKQRYQKELGEDEIGYIALALALSLERQRTKIVKKTILLVCSSGTGSAKLLAFKLQDTFGDYIKQVRTCDARSVSKIDFSEIDYIFTTIPINVPVPVPIREVRYFMENKDINVVRRLFESEGRCNIAEYYPPGLFFDNVMPDSKEAVLRYLCDEVGKQKNIPADFYEAVMKREKCAQTAFGNMVAMPHPYKALTEETFVSVCILQKPILWDEHQMVQAVFLVAVAKKSSDKIQLFYKIMSKLLLSKSYINELIKKSSYSTLIKLLNKIEYKMEEEKNGR